MFVNVNHLKICGVATVYCHLPRVQEVQQRGNNLKHGFKYLLLFNFGFKLYLQNSSFNNKKITLSSFVQRKPF